ncbi:TPA: hypothetical protein ACOIKH_004669 [Klebsiella aerogenes]
MKKTILTGLMFLMCSSMAFADDEQGTSTLTPTESSSEPDLSTVPPPPPPTIQEQIQQSQNNNTQEPVMRNPLPSDTPTPPVTITPNSNPAPPDDAPTTDDLNKSTEPPPAISDQPAD